MTFLRPDWDISVYLPVLCLCVCDANVYWERDGDAHRLTQAQARSTLGRHKERLSSFTLLQAIFLATQSTFIQSRLPFYFHFTSLFILYLSKVPWSTFASNMSFTYWLWITSNPLLSLVSNISRAQTCNWLDKAATNDGSRRAATSEDETAGGSAAYFHGWFIPRNTTQTGGQSGFQGQESTRKLGCALLFNNGPSPQVNYQQLISPATVINGFHLEQTKCSEMRILLPGTVPITLGRADSEDEAACVQGCRLIQIKTQAHINDGHLKTNKCLSVYVSLVLAEFLIKLFEN